MPNVLFTSLGTFLFIFALTPVISGNAIRQTPTSSASLHNFFNGLGVYVSSSWKWGLVNAGIHHDPENLKATLLTDHAQDTDHPLDQGEDFADGDDRTVIAHWALLIAGSNGWGNYRHQADVCHAYQVLKRGGYQDQHIVVMIYDDLAHNPLNPAPGKIFNRPGGIDVYAGLVPDYSGDSVTASVFLAVLAGDVEGVKGKGSGKVIASGPKDRVFIFYSDHGAPGVLGMPTGNFLFADDLMKGIKQKHRAGGFKEMVLYIEACESGSMFDGLLSSRMNVLGVTAANGEESSWGTYCPGADGPSDERFDTCLGDLFSVAWMENAEESDLTIETMQKQFFITRLRTSDNFTYNMGSHVMQFGNLSIQKDLAGDYEGTHNKGIPPSTVSTAAYSWSSNHHHHAVQQRDADLEPLRYAYSRADSQDSKERAKAALDRELAQRRAIDRAVNLAATRLLLTADLSSVLLTHMGLPNLPQHLLAKQQRDGSVAGVHVVSDGLIAAAANSLTLFQGMELLVSRQLVSRANEEAPVVDSWPCLHAMVDAWQEACGAAMNQYAMKHTRFMANLCNAGVGSGQLQAALAGTECGPKSMETVVE